MDLDEVYSDLLKNLGENNLQFEYFSGDDREMEGLNTAEMLKRMFSKVKLTYLPSGIVFLGTESDTQIKNAINVMEGLKRSLGK